MWRNGFVGKPLDKVATVSGASVGGQNINNGVATGFELVFLKGVHWNVGETLQLLYCKGVA